MVRRTAVVNQIRGLLLERGLGLPKGRSHLEQALPKINRRQSRSDLECVPGLTDRAVGKQVVQ